jgi:hypothetical protein
LRYLLDFACDNILPVTKLSSASIVKENNGSNDFIPKGAIAFFAIMIGFYFAFWMVFYFILLARN